ncbi:integrase, partial [Vibrio breoganii]|uniref:tyrosine-type recombinase/integrase n=1 Tax=Vibrio breoganii TaxID=553239 RepID=UPI000C85BAA0
WRSLELHVFPQLANVLIKDLSAPKVIEVLKPLEAKGSLETVKRVCQRLNEIMTFAVNTGMLGSNPLVKVNVAFKSPKKQHMKSISPRELPQLMRAISMANIHKTTRCLLEFQLHTITRPSEASGARWDEIDFQEKLWIIPASRMKKRKIHQVPLSSHMLALLKYTRSITPKSDYIFPSIKSPKLPMHSQTANMALKRMGFAGRLVSHGLRSLASTTLNDEGFNRDVIESALAHIDPNTTRSAYNRATYLDQRRDIMNWWSTHIEHNSFGTLSILDKNYD